jgi:hypothetical protein
VGEGVLCTFYGGVAEGDDFVVGFSLWGLEVGEVG